MTWPQSQVCLMPMLALDLTKPSSLENSLQPTLSESLISPVRTLPPPSRFCTCRSLPSVALHFLPAACLPSTRLPSLWDLTVSSLIAIINLASCLLGYRLSLDLLYSFSFNFMNPEISGYVFHFISRARG